MGIANYFIKEVDARDLEAAARLLRLFFEEEGFAGDLEQIRSRLAEMLEDSRCWATLAFDQETPIGVATVSTNRGIEFGLQGEIGDLYVVSGYRKRGVARQLIHRCVDWCRKIGCTSVQVTITPEGETRHGLKQFYRALDFADTGRSIMCREIS